MTYRKAHGIRGNVPTICLGNLDLTSIFKALEGNTAPRRRPSDG